MGIEKIRFIYIETDDCLVAKGEGDLEGIVVQATTLDKLKQEVKDVFCGYIDIPSEHVPDLFRKVTKNEWDNSVHITEFLTAIAKVWAEEQTSIKKAKTSPETINYLVGKIMQHTKGKCKSNLALQVCRLMVNSD